MQLKMTREHKLMAFLLNRKFNYTMTAIAQLMRVSQSTISSSIKEVEYWRTIQDLTSELDNARLMLEQQGISLQNTPTLYLD